ncbi:radical SAM protein with 4Fe4S-binding SPASM domain [Paenibacillus phyllosphaerae]|uniref:Radical SAM protein with 4Fe4S-binding SPASM domain n=1 Tax=Paenibacillus phyllosphaerae TaxID=274593 RepID=A0A7W5AT93_9BACL|nr:radical SAM protein [Paenibacillus phyllosphaerae]MBB3108129.1 radical SAM protein with 4Fe4S-binding SPASM domain [Paenibacillus phyllosphaerae]
MQPKSRVELDELKFERLKRTIKNIAVPLREKSKNPTYKTDVPESVGIKLTNRCNLRCIHCYQWNEDGYHHNMPLEEQNRELDIELFRHILEETREKKSRLYIWGGEPLFHRKFDEILDLLAEDRRETVICTNALLMGKYMDKLCAISDGLDFLIAIEGFQSEHDFIRGKGSFKKAMDSIDELVRRRKEGLFRGSISIHTVINENMIGHMTELVEMFEAKGVDLVILCFPWYISQETSLKMDHYFKETFSWLNRMEEGKVSSWHAYKYKFNPDKLPQLMDELKRINERFWNTRVRYQPGLELREIDEFIRGEQMTPSRCGNHCLALSTRMDVNPDGTVTACKFFAEFQVGDLKANRLSDVWHSKSYDGVREIINGQGLTPVCSKCSVLYLHGI